MERKWYETMGFALIESRRDFKKSVKGTVEQDGSGRK